uniref:Uncharacterized protein n=1 Tax=Tetranychus urticae TaxID=32264 RepID=T1KIG2_TETUR
MVTRKVTLRYLSSSLLSTSSATAITAISK